MDNLNTPAKILIGLIALAAGSCKAADDTTVRPKLILQITVDQLRGDLPTRYYDRLGSGGLRYLWEQGIVFTDAHHAHANTETIVGHTTLATGAHPSAHGMVGNLWFDRTTGFVRYNVEDPDYGLLTAGADVNKAAEIDPTQRAARSEGRSPAAILVSTFSDELRASTAGKAKAIGISVKDRGAIAMAGHAGTAYWFSKATGEFVTSTYYQNEYPDWLEDHNRQGPARRFENGHWDLLHDQNSYLFGDSDDRAWEADVAGFGRVFPHHYGVASSPHFGTLLTLGPAGDSLVLELAKRALIEEELGKDTITDFLSLSFSSTDYVGHVFGPSSLEAEDNLLHLDQTLAGLLAFVDSQVGLDNTLIVFSADHGGPDAPGYLNSLGIPAAYVDPDTWESDAAIERLKKRFQIGGALFETYSHPYLYFSAAVKSDDGIDREALEAAVVNELTNIPGVSTAVSSAALMRGELPNTRLYQSVNNNFHPKRSGDIYIVFEPNHFINDFDGLEVASTHGSPWNYDTFVPLVFAGAGLLPRYVNRRVYTVDIAPTMSAILRIRAPSGSVGNVLSEVIRDEE